jgi:Tol biopolymer transport system component
VAPVEALDTSPRNKQVLDWSRDGRYIIESVLAPKTNYDIWVLPLFGDRKPYPYLQTEFNESGARLSPNGRWLAYASDETGQFELYVQSFPTPGGKWQVSINGGSRPVWSRDGKELYYIAGGRRMMAVEVKSGAKLELGVPQPLFEASMAFVYSGPSFDVSSDGRFLIPTQLEQISATPMTVVLNWASGLK